MIVIGLTGSVGMGKSTTAGMFADAGVPVFDADHVVHRLQGPGGRALPAIERRFPGTTGPQGLDRAIMGKIAFNDPHARRALQDIVFPLVALERARWLAWQRRRGVPIVLFDIPLLFESGMDRQCDLTCVVWSPAFLQQQRVLRRAGMTRERLQAVRRAQMPTHQKRRRADVSIPTGLGLATTRRSVRKLLACLRVRRLSGCRHA